MLPGGSRVICNYRGYVSWVGRVHYTYTYNIYIYIYPAQFLIAAGWGLRPDRDLSDVFEGGCTHYHA